MTEQERCENEIAEIERQLRSGHPDVEGLCLALADWSTELRLIEQEIHLKAGRLGAEDPAKSANSRAEQASWRQSRAKY